jgi:hypothetical protein
MERQRIPNEAELEAFWLEQFPRLRDLSDTQVMDVLEQTCFSVDDAAELAVWKLRRKVCSDELAFVYLALLRDSWRSWLFQGKTVETVPLAYCLARYLEEVRGLDLVDVVALVEAARRDANAPAVVRSPERTQ